ncbi:MAG TPA: hypothetical protein VEB63_11205 [Chitinophagaceae bacterium]|nr:hypothetical protein [Chitinophagaceae bacterium]
MKQMRIAFAALMVFSLFACSKPVITPGAYRLSYGDSILYLKNQASDHIIHPTEHRPGTYEGFPDGIEIDETTGAINVSKSETGLRYRITHTAPDGRQTRTMVVISGINYTDKFYNLSQHDTIAPPVYNAGSGALPVNGSIFDEGNLANSSGCSVATVNGRINLAETVRNGWLGNPPANDAKREIDIVYRLNDRSQRAVNKVRVKLYFYHSMATVAPDLLETLQERESDGVFLTNQPIRPGASVFTESVAAAAKPRPPCIIIIAN